MRPTTLMTGIAMGECPRWHEDRLWFSDWGAQRLMTVDPDGNSAVVANVPSMPSCVGWLPDGRTLVLSSAEQRLACLVDGDLVTHADLSGLPAKPWNEVVVDPRGNAFVNNIGFNFPGGEFAPGFVAVVPPDGAARVVADDFAFPNGMAVTPDGSTLIVAESYSARLTAFDIEPDGGLANRRVWADLGVGAAPDGICLDAEGALWYASVPGRHCVRVREGGEVLATVDADLACFACALGGPDGRTLFIIAAEWPLAMDGRRTGEVQTISVEVPGVA
jgi:sugar lactone lactonase YvrE